MFCRSKISDKGYNMQTLLSLNKTTALQWKGNAKINVPEKQSRQRQKYFISETLLLRKA